MPIPENFDVAFECGRAVRMSFDKLELRLIHTLKPVSFDAADGRYFPTVWENHERFICGYQTDKQICVVFAEWPVADIEVAKKFAARVSGLAAEQGKGLR